MMQFQRFDSCSSHGIYKNNSLHLARKHAQLDICPRTLSVPRSEHFSERGKLEESCELRGTDNV